MRIREAKDFLIEQIKKEAEIQGFALDELEIKMLYFTEQGGMLRASEEFDAKYDSAKYEKKIANLMQGAYCRLKREHPASKEMWDRAISRLKKGDHYILVMWDANDSASNTLWVMAFASVAAAILFGVKWFAASHSPPNPHILFGIFIGIAALAIFLPRVAGKIVDFVLENMIERFFGKDDEAEDA